MSNAQPGFIRRTFAFFWRALTWLRVGLANLLFLLIIVLVISSIWSKEEFQMPDKTALRVAPSGFLVDQYSYTDPLSQLIGSGQDQPAETLVSDLVKAVDLARKDKHITALILDLNYLMGGGQSKLTEIGHALERFKESGKPIYALSDSYSQDQYFLATFADEILLHPMGSVLLTGYGSYRNYFKSALDKLNLTMHVFRAGQYKDAVEPYLRDDMSDASREHNSRWLQELWGSYTATVEDKRHLEAGAVNHYINDMDKVLAQHQGDMAAAALSTGLVDHLLGQAEQESYLMDKVGNNEQGTSFQALDTDHYLALTHTRQALQQQNSPKIGLLVAKGMILDGVQPPGEIGGDSLAQLLRDARNNDDLEALVVRVDSPGGSAFASEIIRQELELTRQQGIPVYISMGSVAASGGYWISMAADEVWATPSTITGSIGVFSAFPTLENTLSKVGIATDGVGTTELAGAMRIDRALSPLAEHVLQQSVNHIYSRFLQVVADARHSTPEQIDVVGQGRVWTGQAAKDLGLVDQLGDLQDVIAAAADKAGLKKYQVVNLETPLSPTEMLIRQISGEMASSTLWTSLRPHGLLSLLSRVEKELAPIGQLLQSADPRAVYAHCLDCMGP